MPGFDGTGPFGTGPFGRGMGPCGGGQASRGRGRGFSRRGFGRGMGSYAVSTVDQKDLLAQQKSWLENQLTAITQRLKDLEEK